MTAPHAAAPTTAPTNPDARGPRAAPLPHDNPDDFFAADDAPGCFARAWRWWLPPALLALALALAFADPFAGDWDALDYTVLAVKGEPSTMLFGRMLFIFTNHLAYRAAHALSGLQPEHAYLLFKYMVVVESPLAVVACWTLARDLTRDVRAATVAALLLACAPFFVIYSGQAMTEIPSVLLLCVALVVHLRGLRTGKIWLVILGAALLGTGNNVREVAAIYGVWLVAGPLACGWKINARNLSITAAACAVFFVCAFAPFLYFYLGDVGGYRAGWHGWVESMRSEESVHPVSVRNFVPLFLSFFVGAPLVLTILPVALRDEWRRHKFSPLFALACAGLFANLMLVTHYSTVINGRYLLTGMPGLVPVVAAYYVRYESRRTGSRRRGFAVAAGGVLLAALVFGVIFFPGSWQTIQSHGLTKEYRARLALLPADAVVLAGGQTVSVNYYRGLGLGRWDVVGTGGGWPTDRLAEVIEEHLRAGRRVFVDTDARLWFNDSWRGQETRELVAAAPRFRFRRVSDTIYEIRPPADATAHDDPGLERLLQREPTRIQKLRDKL
ncbi:MAG: glycosyltransferase family 39 protein [Acidobacteria bacterium]|nr:glycosyltransferase family 39 protein [Acidobacteriota bacterium]